MPEWFDDIIGNMLDEVLSKSVSVEEKAEMRAHLHDLVQRSGMTPEQVKVAVFVARIVAAHEVQQTLRSLSSGLAGQEVE